MKMYDCVSSLAKTEQNQKEFFFFLLVCGQWIGWTERLFLPCSHMMINLPSIWRCWSLFPGLPWNPLLKSSSSRISLYNERRFLWNMHLFQRFQSKPSPTLQGEWRLSHLGESRDCCRHTRMPLDSGLTMDYADGCQINGNSPFGRLFSFND